MIFTKKGYRSRLFRLAKRLLVFIALTAFNIILFRSIIGVMWLYVTIATSVFVLGKLAISFLFFVTVRYYHLKNNRVKRTLLVGQNETMGKVEKIIKANPILNYNFIGYISDSDATEKETLGSRNDLERVIVKNKIQIVFVAIKDATALLPCFPLNQDLLTTCNRLGVRLFYVPEKNNVDKNVYDVEYLNSVTIINPQRIPMDSIENQIKKRLFDVLFSGFVIIFVLSWLYPLLALIIKLSSKGPVLFIQERTGINQVNFKCYKFRSMALNDDADKKQATNNDPRLTWIGKIMRKTSIDELPQFFNVLKGDMSVVGPRPHMLAHTEEYTQLIDNYLVRHYVKPGITGWAQVEGFRGETNQLWKMEKRVELDKEYVNNWSLDWDIVIIWKTIFGMKSHNNAF
ncbi:undecaprenyl-phosphate glucose phosphotransferase [Paludibacter sp.]